MNRLSAMVTFLSLLLVAACHNPAADTNRAITGEAQRTASPPATGATTYAITPPDSKVDWIGSQVTGSHTGSFEKFNGEIHYANNDVAQSHVQITIDAASVKADDPKLTEHLKTADFFDVTKFPEAKFESTSIKAGGEKGATHTVTGNLTLHGVTKSVTFPATIAITPTEATVDANFSINRRDFGISYAGPTNNLIRDEVVMKLMIRAKKAK